MFAASEDGVGALWRSPLFGLAPQRLFGVTVKAGESGTLYDFEHDGSTRVVAARTDRPFRDTELIPGDTCYVAGDNAAAVDRNDGVALWQVAGSRAPQPGKTWIALGILVAVVVAASFGLAPVALVASAGAVLDGADRRPAARGRRPAPSTCGCCSSSPDRSGSGRSSSRAASPMRSPTRISRGLPAGT